MTTPSTPEPITVVVYHAPCIDGFFAALAAWRAFNGGGERAVRYVPSDYDNRSGDVRAEIPDGSHVYFLDYTLPPANIIKLAQRVASLTVLDHHETAAKAWERYLAEHETLDVGDCRLSVVFDLEQSGAMLAWKHFHPATPPPPLYPYVEDRDLWRWALDDSNAVSAWLETSKTPMDPSWFGVWAATAFQPIPKSAWAIGHSVLNARERLIDRALADAMRVKRDGLCYLLVNCPVLQSEIADKALADNTRVDVAAVWYMTQNGRIKTSLRTRRGTGDADAPHAGELAQALGGGGGHPGAGGFYSEGLWWVE